MDTCIRSLFSLVLLGMLACFAPLTVAGEPLAVCATVPELGSIVREVGGERVAVTVFAKGTDDPHYLDAKPSYIRALADADLFVQVGLDLEAGWVPALLTSARNARVQPGALGYLDASGAVAPLEIPGTPVDRTMGDIHPRGNPHYLTDPLNGLRVAALVRDRLIALDPLNEEGYRRLYQDFRGRLGEMLVGARLAAKYDFEKLALLQRHGRLADFLREQNDADALGGWLGQLLPHRGAAIFTYHKSWPYFADRFGLEVVGRVEPKPGIPPSPSHLLHLLELARSKNVGVLLMEPWLPMGPARTLANKSGLQLAKAAISTSVKTPYSYLDGVDGVVAEIAPSLDASN